MSAPGRSRSASQAGIDVHVVSEADLLAVVGIMSSKFSIGSQFLVSTAPTPLWNIKRTQVYFDLANGEKLLVDMFAACHGAQDGPNCGHSACLSQVQIVADVLYFFSQPKRAAVHFPLHWTEEEKVEVCRVRPWTLFMVVAAALLRHHSEHKQLRDSNMSAADKALTSKVELMSDAWTQAEVLKQAGMNQGGVVPAGTAPAQAAMAGSSLAGLAQAGVCVGGVPHPGASHAGSTSGRPNTAETAEGDVSKEDQDRQDELGRMLDATEASSALALSKAQRRTSESAARRAFDDDSLLNDVTELDSMRLESSAESDKFKVNMQASELLQGLNLSAANQISQMTVPITKHNEHLTQITNWHEQESSSMKNIAARRQDVLAATDEQLRIRRAAAPLALGNASAALQLAPGPPRNTLSQGPRPASQPTGLPRLPAPPLSGSAGPTGASRLQPPARAGSAGPSLLRQKLSLTASATASILPGQRSQNLPASTIAGLRGHGAPATTVAGQSAQSALASAVTGQIGQSTPATTVAGRSSDASGCSPMSISPAQSVAAASLPLLQNHPSFPMLASAQTLRSSFTVPPALLAAAMPPAASGIAGTAVLPARGRQGGAGSGASTQRVAGLACAAGTPAAPPTFPGPSTPFGAATRSIQLPAWTLPGTPGTSFTPSVTHLPAAGVQASIGLLPLTTLPGPATPATPSDVNMSPGSPSTGRL